MIGNNSTNACAQMFAKKEDQASESMRRRFALVAVMTERASFPRWAELMKQFGH
jgi:hypothetical protein